MAEITRRAHAVGAQVFVDAVHYAPHRAMDVKAWGCDYLVCSAYKFFGPHTGTLWGRAALLTALPVSKLRPVSNALPHRWLIGTQNHEGIAGTLAAVEYLAALGRDVRGRDLEPREAIVAAFEAIEGWERQLCDALLEGIAAVSGVRIWGITDPQRSGERTPTVAFTHPRRSPKHIARALAERGIFAWSGNSYALPLTEALGLEPEGVVRVGLLHYNTIEEVEGFVETLASCVA